MTTSTHHFRGSHGYESLFQVTGRSARTVVDLVNPAEPVNFAAHLVVGIVTNTEDPDKLGRVKVKYPTLNEMPGEPLGAARVPVRRQVRGRGFFVMPAVDDEVVLGFEHGDLSRPYVIGSVYTRQVGAG